VRIAFKVAVVSLIDDEASLQVVLVAEDHAGVSSRARFSGWRPRPTPSCWRCVILANRMRVGTIFKNAVR